MHSTLEWIPLKLPEIENWWEAELTKEDRDRIQDYFYRLTGYLSKKFSTRLQYFKWWWQMLPKVIILGYMLKWHNVWLRKPLFALPKVVRSVLEKKTTNFEHLKLTYLYLGLLIVGHKQHKPLLPQDWQIIFLIRRWTSLIRYVMHYQQKSNG